MSRSDEGVFAAIREALNKRGVLFDALAGSPSTEAAVMSRGAPANANARPVFSADHNYHFFSHAYISLSLQLNDGLIATQAETVSAIIGAQYELLEGSLSECSCNAG
jgi:hypothetical protein